MINCKKKSTDDFELKQILLRIYLTQKPYSHVHNKFLFSVYSFLFFLL
jgi:hypothetical protein